MTEWHKKMRLHYGKHDRCFLVGDVLYASWGYEQTNIDFYQVIGLVGKRSVILREIRAKQDESYFKNKKDEIVSTFSGFCIPAMNDFVGKEFIKQVSLPGDEVKLSSYARAKKLQPESVIDGIPVFKPLRYSSYA